MIETFLASKTRRLVVVFLIGMLTMLASCQKSKMNSTSAPSKRPKIDPCGLISAEEVRLAVTQSDPASPKARNPKDFWKETFGRYEGETKEEKGDEEKRESLREQDEEKGRPPKKMEGIGEAAYWTANRVGGALYVLKNDVFIRISVGGPESEEAKINNCKALAEKALSRL